MLPVGLRACQKQRPDSDQKDGNVEDRSEKLGGSEAVIQASPSCWPHGQCPLLKLTSKYYDIQKCRGNKAERDSKRQHLITVP